MAMIDVGRGSKEVDTDAIERQLQEAARSAGVQYDKSDYEGVLRNLSYDSGGASVEQALANARDNYRERGGNTPGQDRSGEAHTGASWYGGAGPAPGPAGPSAFGPGSPTFHNTFNDPLTKQYEQMLQTQMALYQQQQAAMQAAAQQAEQRRAQTAAAVDRVSQFMNQRVQKLQGPAYTGTEAEVLRSQLLDPIERDRSAARQRALEQIGARGFDPSSGIAQELMRRVDAAYDEHRSMAQGSLASRQIQEQRSREQEAQSLLQYLAMLPDAVARGDLDFVAYVQNLIAQPGQQGLSVADVLAELPTRRLNDALATLGMAPSIGGASSQAIQMLQLAQNQRAQNQANAAQYWGNLGRSFMP